MPTSRKTLPPGVAARRSNANAGPAARIEPSS
jgi:hypothetical protein